VCEILQLVNSTDYYDCTSSPVPYVNTVPPCYMLAQIATRFAFDVIKT
jgi:hypothetical protein